MTPSEPHETEQLVRYAENDLPPAERAAVAQHLETCKPCQEFLSFVKDFTAALREAQPRSAVPGEACPDASLMVELAGGELNEHTAQHVRAHVAFCSNCLEELFLLEQVKTAERPEEASWQKLLERLRAFLVDLGRTYGPGVVLGHVRIVAESPTFALRGGEVSDRVFKVLEVSVGPNTYSVEVAMTTGGSVQFDVAGFNTPHKTALQAAVHAEGGEVLFATETDEHGNANFTLSKDQVPQGECVLVFNMDSSETHVLIRLPEILGGGKVS